MIFQQQRELERQQNNFNVSISLVNTKLSDLLNAAFPGSVKILHIPRTPEDFTLKIAGSNVLLKFLVYLKDKPSQFLSRISSIPKDIEGDDVL